MKTLCLGRTFLSVVWANTLNGYKGKLIMNVLFNVTFGTVLICLSEISAICSI